MPKTRVSCPNCRQPVLADIEQLFDVGVDPSAKQRLLSGAVNMIQCPNCGFQGSLATPIVYHDPDKELLLTFVPSELGIPRNEQERLIGSMINQVLKNLPQEKRKAYLLQPQTTLTMQGMVERILEADGITREMIQSQQQRVNLIQRLLATPEDALKEVVQQEDQLIDAEFFSLLRRLAEASLVSGDQQSAQQLAGLQERLIPLTSFGKTMQEQSQEIEAAIAQLRSAGDKLDRQMLLDFVINAPSETRLRAFVSLARPFMDYSFFQILSDRIDRARGDGRSRLISLREQLLEMTHDYDQQVEARSREARQLVNAIVQAEDIQQAMMQNLPAVDEFFVQELDRLQDEARKRGDLEQLDKLQKMIDVLQQASSTPPEMELIEELLDIPDAQEQRNFLEEHKDEITPEFLSALTNIASQVDGGEDKELAERIKELNRAVLRFSMEQKFR